MTEYIKSNYIFRAINDEVEIQILLWNLVDLLAKKKRERMDYFQTSDIKFSDKQTMLFPTDY